MRWLKIIGPIVVLLAVRLAKPTTHAAAVAAELLTCTSIFCLLLLSSSIARHLLLRLLLSTTDADAAADDIVLRLALTFFPSTAGGEALFERAKLLWEAAGQASDPIGHSMRRRTASTSDLSYVPEPVPGAMPPPLTRVTTDGAGSLPSSLTLDELPSLSALTPPLGVGGRSERLQSVLFVQREE